MMLMMIIFAILFAGGLYAMQVPAIKSELDILLTGTSRGGGGNDPGHFKHIVFIMFTLTSPLLLASVLSSGLAFWNWFTRR